MSGEASTFAWEAYDAYLFDIDGTLLNCTDAVQYFAFCDALHLLAGRPLNLDGVVVHGNTDVGILRDALLLAGVPEHQWRSELPHARAHMGRFVNERSHDLRTAVLPGVHDLLQHLGAQDKVLGVATGNLEEIGRAKLKCAGLLEHFSFGGYSDAFEYRRDVFRSAEEKARNLVGQHARICVIGDTPEDVRAARANNLDVIAVATGIFDMEALQGERPDLCLKSLSQFETTPPA